MTLDDGRRGGSKVSLLLRLLSALDQGSFGFEELKRRLDSEHPPSTRTLRRYLATLSEAGFPWYYDRESGTYRFEGGYSLRRLELSSDELTGLLALREIAGSLGDDLSATVDEVTRKIVGVADSQAAAGVSKSMLHLQISGASLDAGARKIFALLRRANRDRQSVKFDYVDKAGKHSRRHVDPYGFVVSAGRVYVIAHDRGRGAKRVFALDGISEASAAPARFSIPEDFDVEAFAAQSVSGIMHGDSVTRVTVRFAPVVARAAKAERILKDRSIADRDDGSVDITYAVSDPLEIVRWSFKWGPEAEILAPSEVRETARRLVRAMGKRYGPAEKKTGA
jgi:predicted DNA-binding transcriptional regulator YafY